MKIAVPITARTMDEALTDMDEASKAADIIELRIDYMGNPNIERLLAQSTVPKIVTNRTWLEGGMFEGSDRERIAYLEEAIELGAEYIDIELQHYQHLSKRKTKKIVSYHNFELTPTNLDDIYKRIADKNPDIVKIATKANSTRDSLRMLELIAQADKDIIGICMGEKGIMTRVYGPSVGGYLTFASLGDGKASAPGQMSVEELRQAWELLQLGN